jgi:predicted small secreted protein
MKKKKNILPIILAVALSLLITACSSETEKLAVSD